MSLRDRLVARIRREGPISIADFMTACLGDPDGGYYATRPRLGAEGDFITAPHVSQMFGELLGLWAAETWRVLGRPDHVYLAEMGPGDGTMIADALRAARADPAFPDACDLWLVETSAPLRVAQKARLGDMAARWVPRLAEIPADAPLILLANELLDCLPVRQAVATAEGWRERQVGLDARGGLSFTLGAPPPRVFAAGRPGEVREWSDAVAELGGEIGRRVVGQGGAALFVDYGRADAGCGDTLQALKDHRRVGPLDHPGESDLTAHADFPAFLAAAREAGAAVTDIAAQGDFLWSVGIGLRARRLAAARPERARLIGRQVERLIAHDQMGALFKVAAVHARGLAVPGFAAGTPAGNSADARA
jgi:SAM-dependent MidA family methyltransferase